jgi:hypothetical protein
LFVVLRQAKGIQDWPQICYSPELPSVGIIGRPHHTWPSFLFLLIVLVFFFLIYLPRDIQLYQSFKWSSLFFHSFFFAFSIFYLIHSCSCFCSFFCSLCSFDYSFFLNFLRYAHKINLCPLFFPKIHI